MGTTVTKALLERLEQRQPPVRSSLMSNAAATTNVSGASTTRHMGAGNKRILTGVKGAATGRNTNQIQREHLLKTGGGKSAIAGVGAPPSSETISAATHPTASNYDPLGSCGIRIRNDVSPVGKQTAGLVREALLVLRRRERSKECRSDRPTGQQRKGHSPS